MITDQQLAELALVLEAEPAFDLLSVEGSFGYPPELLDLDISDIEYLVALSENYARDGQALASADSASASTY